MMLPNIGPDYSIRQCIGNAISLASVCWAPRPNGEFDITMASKIMDEVMANIDAYVDQRIQEQKATQQAKYEAMRPGQEKVMTPPRGPGWEMMKVPERHQDGPGYEPLKSNHPLVYPIYKCGSCDESYNVQTQYVSCPHRDVTSVPRVPVKIKDNPQA